MLALITPGVRTNLYRMALGITKHPAAAESVLEDSITKTIEKIDPAREIKFLPYLYMVVRNRAFDWVRRFCKQREYIKKNSIDVTARSAFADAISKEALEMFDRVVKRLTRKERRAILLKVVDQLTFVDIAKKMKITALNARQLVFRARGRLQVWMRDLRAV